jgi:HSP20 family molecular chaperone IbpA
MFPFTNPLNGNPFQNNPGNNTGNQPGANQNGVNGFNPFNGWQNPLQQGFPINSEQLQKQINDTISSYMPDFLKSNAATPTTPHQQQPPSHEINVFETHDFVVARIPVSENQPIPKLTLDTYRLYVKGMPGQEKETVSVPLPAPIKPKYTKADYKSGILEVRMLKKGPEPMTEISIED